MEKEEKIMAEGTSDSSKKKNSTSGRRDLAATGSGSGISHRTKPSLQHSESAEKLKTKSSCFCNLVISGPKLCCVKCERIYHARCLGIPASKIDKIGSFFCPICAKPSPNSKSALDSVEKTKRILEKEKEKKHRDDVLRANYKQVVNRANNHRKSHNSDLEKAIQLSIADQINKVDQKEEKEKEELDSEEKILKTDKSVSKPRASSAPSVLRSTSQKSPSLISPLSRKVLKDKKKKEDKISRRLHDALDDSLMAEDLMKADEERLLQYTLQLSIVEQEKK